MNIKKEYFDELFNQLHKVYYMAKELKTNNIENVCPICGVDRCIDYDSDWCVKCRDNYYELKDEGKL